MEYSTDDKVNLFAKIIFYDLQPFGKAQYIQRRKNIHTTRPEQDAATAADRTEDNKCYRKNERVREPNDGDHDSCDLSSLTLSTIFGSTSPAFPWITTSNMLSACVGSVFTIIIFAPLLFAMYGSSAAG